MNSTPLPVVSMLNVRSPANGMVLSVTVRNVNGAGVGVGTGVGDAFGSGNGVGVAAGSGVGAGTTVPTTIGKPCCTPSINTLTVCGAERAVAWKVYVAPPAAKKMFWRMLPTP